MEETQSTDSKDLYKRFRVLITELFITWMVLVIQSEKQNTKTLRELYWIINLF